MEIAPFTSVDPFLSREYTRDYNCLDFVREVWLSMTGENVTDKLQRLTGAFADRKATLSGIRGFKKLKTPKSPCFVVFQRKNLDPHIGIFLEGKVLHLHARGVEYQPVVVAKRLFDTVKYYR